MNFGLIPSFECTSYAGLLKPLLEGNPAFVANPSTVAEAELWAKQRNITAMLVTDTDFIKRLLNLHSMRRSPSLEDYAGSLIKRNNIEYLIIPPCKQLRTVRYGKFLTKRLISKILHPEKWRKTPDFSWEMFDMEKAEEYLRLMESSLITGVDSETTQDNLRIICVSYTIIHENLTSTSFVVPCDSMFNLTWIRKYNASSAIKVLQNGKYDCAYFFRFNCPLVNYLFDTINAFHCWYAELPKDLGFISAFFIRDCLFWKDLAYTGNRSEYFEYACRDTWGTAYSFLFWLLESPAWAKRNYLAEFPSVFPNHFMEMLGVKQDHERLAEVKTIKQKEDVDKTTSLNRMLGTKNFNPRSSKQMKSLLGVLGFPDADSAKESELKKYMYAHPLNERILELCSKIVKCRKEISTYLNEQKSFRGRLLYQINGHGTDSGRSNSRAHHFWCGQNIQNMTRDGEASFVKETIVADEGFGLAEVDEKQAETYDTAYASGDPELISAINSSQDFHSRNASAFFGKNYEDIWDSVKGKSKDKPLRDLSKRTNHGANYLMGAKVFLDTIGPKMVREAQRFLRLPPNWKLLQITEFLLERFHALYRTLRKVYYPAVIHEVTTTSMLIGATGWVRFCFGQPKDNKPDLNAYVAHISQSLNAKRLEQATIRIFFEVQMNPEFCNNIRMYAHIHDSNLFGYRLGHEYICEEVRKRMEIPITIKGADGKVRTYTVPCDIKNGKNGKPAFRWSDTE